MLASLVLPFALTLALKDDDRVLFYGDSITEQRLYTTYVETLVRTRFPSLKVEFVSRGVGGDTAFGGWMGTAEERVRRDIEPYKPTRVTIMLGMNDAKYVPHTQELEKDFADSYEKLVRNMKTVAPNAKFTLIRTSPYDEFSSRPVQFKGYNDTLIRFGKHVLDLSRRGGHEFVDFNAPLAKLIRNANSHNSSLASLIIPDEIHPAESGHIIMAGELAKSWGVKGNISSFWLDAGEGRIIQAENTKIVGVNGLTWSQLDSSIPFPTDAKMVPTLIFSDFNDVINRQALRVTRLEPGEYRVLIDGKEIGSWMDRELSAGVNLTIVDTPMKDQAKQVLKIVAKRSELDFEFWRNSVKNPPSEAEQKAHESALRDLDDQARAAAKPKMHKFELQKI